MKTEQDSLNSLWADLIIEELIRNGVDYFFLSPGSRCSPLTAAVALNTRTRHTVHFDERASAYAALNFARATGSPAVLICTSGTAAANYLPAVVETSMSYIPLIILTADRPPELRHTSANQTIDQVKLYGDYVRFFFDLPCPDSAIPPETILTTIDQAVYRSLRTPAGPVHLNCMFREPLAPVGPQQDYKHYLSSIQKWQTSTTPYTQYHKPAHVPELKSLEPTAEIIKNSERGIIIAGRLRSDREREAVSKLCRALPYPLLTDITSGLRGADINCRILHYDLAFAYELTEKQLSPATTVIHLGGEIISKRLWQWLQAVKPEHYFHIASHPLRHDPNHQVTSRFECDPDLFVDFLLPFLAERKNDTDWLRHFKSYASAIEKVINEIIDTGDKITEPAVARMVARHIQNDTCLFIANSMPIRDFDTFAEYKGLAIPIGCNRGASGIDGTVASAVGFAIGHDKPATLVTGDLALLHDLNSLAMVTSTPNPITIVVINNNGGGIFSFLPIAERTDIFEPYWGAPHGLTFESAAKMFHLDYKAPSSKDEFIEIYKTAQRAKHSTIIEIFTDRRENLNLHNRVCDAVVKALKECRAG